jgi:amidase
MPADSSRALSRSSATLIGRTKLILPANLPSDLTDMSATQLSAAIHQRLVSCEEVMSAYLHHIQRYNPTYNAIVSLLPEDECLQESRKADRELARGDSRGWMHGMPHAVKDLADAKGLPTNMGSPIFSGALPANDDFTTGRIRRQGAIFIGKTNVPEFGMGSQTYNSVFGATGSAYDPQLTAGGSSGGAACGLATRMLPVADGSDLMGSLRNPAAYNNVVGFRPSQGRVPGRTDGDLFYQQLATNGPMGRNTEDTIHLFSTMAGPSDGNPLGLHNHLPTADNFLTASLTGLKLGWLGDYAGHLPMDAGVLEICEASLATLSSHGVIVEPCTAGFDMQRLWKTWLTLRHWSSYRLRELYEDQELRDQLKPEVVWEIEGALNTSSQAIYNAGLARADWFRTMHALFNHYDLLVLPSAQVFPFSKGVHWPTTINGRAMDTYHRWMEVVIGGTLAGVPTINLPAGFDKAGRPMGLQVMGRFGEDKKVLEFALAFETVTDHLTRRPQLVELA